MKPLRSIRIALALLLIITGLGISWALWILLQHILTDISVLLTILGSLVTLGFCAFFAKELLGKGPVSKGSLLIGVALGIVTIFLAYSLLSGLYMDSIGEQCRGLMGSWGSCMFGPQLLVWVVVFSPLPMLVIGAIAALGIFGQLSAKKQLVHSTVSSTAQKKPQ